MATNSESNMGVGFTGYVTDSGVLLAGRPSKIVLNSKLELKRVYGYPFYNPGGRLQKVDSIVDSEDYTCKVSTGSYDQPEIERIFDQLASASNFTIPDAKVFKVAAGGTVTLTGLTANQMVGVFFDNDVDAKYLKQIVTGTPTVDEYIVSANTITVHSSWVDKDLIVCYYKPITGVQAIGVNNNPVGDLSFFGALITPRIKIPPRFYIPKMSRASGFSFGSSGETDIEYDCVLKTGFALPIVFAFGLPMS